MLKRQAGRASTPRQLRKRRARSSNHELAISVLKRFRVIFGSVRQHFREVERVCGVSGSQLWILQEVSAAPGIGVSDLASRLAIHQSTCSQLVEKLVQSGHIAKERSAKDQRRVGLELTKKGRRTVADAPGPAEGVLPEALSGLSSSSLQGLHRYLEAVIANMELGDEGAADKHLADL